MRRALRESHGREDLEHRSDRRAVRCVAGIGGTAGSGCELSGRHRIHTLVRSQSQPLTRGVVGTVNAPSRGQPSSCGPCCPMLGDEDIVASDAQIRANRLNAQRSTGPQTENGKRAVRYNALKHGLLAEASLLPGHRTLPPSRRGATRTVRARRRARTATG
jgi:hypothetical protein